MAGTRNVAVYAGDDYTHTVTVVDSAGDPVDLSDRTWTAMWRLNRKDSVSVSFTVDDTDAATGVLIVSLTKAQTAALDHGVWDLQGTYTDDTVETLLTGTVHWTKDVTRT